MLESSADIEPGTLSQGSLWMGDADRVCLRHAEVAGVEQLDAIVAREDLVGDGGDVELRDRSLQHLSIARASARRLRPLDAHQRPGGGRQRGDLDGDLAGLGGGERMHHATSSDGDRSGKRFNLVLRRIDDPAAADAESTGHGKHERGTKPATHYVILHERLTASSALKRRIFPESL